jgi:hypothetical protein
MTARLIVADSVHDIQFLALAFRKFPTHTHAGIIYRDVDGEVFMLELRGPNELHREACRPSVGWTIPTLKREELRLVAQMCDLVWTVHRANQDIPYDIEYTRDGRFNANTGQLELGGKLKGLTCATFVLAVFNSFNIQLLELDSWQIRPDDIEWQHWIAECFQDPGLAAKSPCLRYRPEEVVGVGLADSVPPTGIPFQIGQELGVEILKQQTEFLQRSGRIA